MPLVWTRMYMTSQIKISCKRRYEQMQLGYYNFCILCPSYDMGMIDDT